MIFFAETGDPKFTLAVAHSSERVGCLSGCDVRHQWIQTVPFFPAHFPGRDKLIEIFAAYHLYARHWRASLVAFGASIVAHLATFTAFLFAAYRVGCPGAAG
jgi:hypothetical protein